MKSNSLQLSHNDSTISCVERFIYQPNRITEAHYNFLLIQERIFNIVKFQLQDAIQKRFKGEEYLQLDLFRKYNSNDIVLEIPLKEIASKQQYHRVREACKQLAGLVVTVPYWDVDQKQKRIRYSGLLRADLPEEPVRSSTIRICIDRQVAKLLIEIDLDSNNKPINYTRYMADVIKKASKKYTPRIYMFLCSWKMKGERIISIEEFRSWLGINEKYKYYRDIKKFILLPVQEDLIRIKADCWYDCNSPNFEIKNRNVVTHLRFQIITLDLQKSIEKQRDYVRYLLQTFFKFNENNFTEIQSIISNTNPNDLINKIEYLRKIIRSKEEKGETVEMIQRYVIQSLKKEFNSS